MKTVQFVNLKEALPRMMGDFVVIHVAAAVSLLLCVAIVTLWVRSYGIGDVWNWDLTYGRAVYSSNGSLIVVDWWGVPEQQSNEWHLPGIRWAERWLAWDASHPADFSYGFQRTISVRYWLPAILTAVMWSKLMAPATESGEPRSNERILHPTPVSENSYVA